MATSLSEQGRALASHIPKGSYRWAIYDRPSRTLYYGGSEVHTHMGVAEESGVLRNPPSYYRPGGNILGGYLCCSEQGFFYFDPYSGTFPGTIEAVREAEEAFKSVCDALGLPFKRFTEIAASERIARDLPKSAD